MMAFLLLPFTLLYYVAILVWDLYWGSSQPVRVEAKVISVGNLAAGGSGKTTLVAHMADRLLMQGKRVAVVARGYKRLRTGPIIVSSDAGIQWEECGDEPAVLAKMIPGLKIYVDSNKTEAARKAALDRHDYVIVDDGFQHRELFRDVDIVCLDAKRPFGNGFLLPSGKLREPKSALKRAEIIVVMDGSSRDKLPFENPSSPVFYARKLFKGARALNGNPANIHGSKLVAFCGIGNPESFKSSLTQADYIITDFMKFRDHYVYSSVDVDRIEQVAVMTGADAAVTTLKDAVKLEQIWTSKFPLYYLDITLELENEVEFLRLIAL